MALIVAAFRKKMIPQQSDRSSKKGGYAIAEVQLRWRLEI